MRRGSNLPDFRAAQLEFAAHIRNPMVNARPADVEARRMQIYADLFYNNIEGFLASGFPVAKKILGEDRWHALVRSFVHLHPSESPYFLEIGQEFLTFLSNLVESSPESGLPPFLLELCHYEWVELALGVSEIEIPQEGVDRQGDLLDHPVAVSPLARRLAYRWPVHQIGPQHVPLEAPAAPTELIVYRRRDDRVAFMVVNPLTRRLVELLELPQLSSKVVYDQGLATIERLRDADVLLGATSHKL